MCACMLKIKVVFQIMLTACHKAKQTISFFQLSTTLIAHY